MNGGGEYGADLSEFDLPLLGEEVAGGEIDANLELIRKSAIEFVRCSLVALECVGEELGRIKREGALHLSDVRNRSGVVAGKIAKAEKERRKALEGKIKRMKRDREREVEEEVGRRTREGDDERDKLREELSALKVEGGYLRGELERMKEEREKELDYAKYRGASDARDEITTKCKALEEENGRLGKELSEARKVRGEESQRAREKGREEAKAEIEKLGGILRKMEVKLRESEARRIEQEHRTKSLLREEVEKLRKNHEDAVGDFRSRTSDAREEAKVIVEGARKEYEERFAQMREDSARQIRTLKEALEVVKMEKRDEVERARGDVEQRMGKEGREQIKALRMAHEAEVRRAGREIVRLQKLLRRREGGDMIVEKEIGGVRTDKDGAEMRRTTRDGKIGGSRLSPTWLTAIDRSGEDLNNGLAMDEADGEKVSEIVPEPTMMGGVLRRSFELRKRAEELNKRAGKDSDDNGKDKNFSKSSSINDDNYNNNDNNNKNNNNWSPLMQSMNEGGASEVARTSVPKPTKGGSTPPRVKNQQTKFGSQSEWAASLHLTEAAVVLPADESKNKPKSKTSQLDEYLNN